MNVSSTLDRALRHHRVGEWAQAESLYRAILHDNPKHADALHLLGMVVLQTGSSLEAERLINLAIQIQPNQAVFHANLAIVLRSQGRHEDAVAACRAALLLDPASIETRNSLAVALFSSGKVADAVECFKQVLLHQPDYLEARVNLLRILNIDAESAAGFHAIGDLFHENAQPTEAVKWYRKAIEIDPASAQTHNNLGNALFASGDQLQALTAYDQALKLKPDFAEAWNNIANVLKELGQVEEAIAAYRRAIELQPKSPEPLSNLANLVREGSQRDLAMQLYQQALLIDPEHAVTHNNIGNAFCEIGKWNSAIVSYTRAIAIKPDYADAINNLGTALEEVGDRDRAMDLYRKASELDPNAVSPPWNIALLQLLQGDYVNGWRGYEHRWRQKRQSRAKRDFKQPLPTDLAELKGKRILLHAEQGFGDAIQFCRYVPMVIDLAADVILECHPELTRLFQQSFNIPVISRGEDPGHFDLQAPLMSLPKLFNTTLPNVPARVPYLSPDLANIREWEAKFAAEPECFRVGLVWAGQSNHQKDRHRSVSFSDFEPLLNVKGTKFYSLQVGDAAIQCRPPVIDWTDDLKDFADTAALIAHLDLVITVDTAVCHLAAAMAKPVWILLAFQPDWRWLLDRDSSPWYPSARLFRQVRPDDWREPLALLLKNLTER